MAKTAGFEILFHTDHAHNADHMNSIGRQHNVATLPTPEQVALEILAIFVEHFRSRPGDVLRNNNFMAVWVQRRMSADDFKPGMEFAVERG